MHTTACLELFGNFNIFKCATFSQPNRFQVRYRNYLISYAYLLNQKGDYWLLLVH